MEFTEAQSNLHDLYSEFDQANYCLDDDFDDEFDEEMIEDE